MKRSEEMYVDYVANGGQLSYEVFIEWQLEQNEEREEILIDALNQIIHWSKAYPLDVFPEPDFVKVRELLDAGGIDLGAVSASNFRHVITEVAKIARNGLASA